MLVLFLSNFNYADCNHFKINDTIMNFIAQSTISTHSPCFPWHPVILSLPPVIRPIKKVLRNSEKKNKV